MLKSRFRIPFFTKKFLGDDYSTDNVKKRVSGMIDLAINDGDSRDLLVEQLSNFLMDMHNYQKLSRSLTSGNFWTFIFVRIITFGFRGHRLYDDECKDLPQSWSFGHSSSPTGLCKRLF